MKQIRVDKINELLNNCEVVPKEDTFEKYKSDYNSGIDTKDKYRTGDKMIIESDENRKIE